MYVIRGVLNSSIQQSKAALRWCNYEKKKKERAAGNLRVEKERVGKGYNAKLQLHNFTEPACVPNNEKKVKHIDC